MVTSDAGLFGPDSVTWRVHADPSMLVGGLRSLLIQALHPLAMAGVDQHSDYRVDPWGRLQRTTDYVMTTTYGDTAAAERAGAAVRAIHARVRGVDPATGRSYRASDPELLAWVHNVEVHSFLTAFRRYGGALSPADADRYVAEMSRAAPLVGLPQDAVPQCAKDLSAVLRAATGLQVTPAAREGLRVILSPPMPLALRPLYAVPTAAAVGLVPRHLRAMYGLVWFPPAAPSVHLTTLALSRALRAVLPGPPHRRAARRRLAAA